MDINWVTLAEYSQKYKLSISTLRRRIKAQQIEFKSVGGKYFLKDVQSSKDLTISNSQLSNSQKNYGPQRGVRLHQNLNWEYQPKTQQVKQPRRGPSKELEESSFSVVKGLLSEIKNSYASVVEEKDKKIAQLQNHIVDLKTLVEVLEKQYVLNKQSSLGGTMPSEGLSNSSGKEKESGMSMDPLSEIISSEISEDFKLDLSPEEIKGAEESLSSLGEDFDFLKSETYFNEEEDSLLEE